MLARGSLRKRRLRSTEERIAAELPSLGKSAGRAIEAANRPAISVRYFRDSGTALVVRFAPRPRPPTVGVVTRSRGKPLDRDR